MIGSTHRRYGWVLLLGALYVWSVGQGWLEYGCPFRRLTGYPCPGCGTTRAVILALKGEWLGSLRANPYGLLLLLLGALLMLWILFDWIKGSGTLAATQQRLNAYLQTHWWILAVAVLAAGVLWAVWLRGC